MNITAIGHTASAAAPTHPNVVAINADELGLAVARQFFSNPPTTGIATNQAFTDALAGGAQLAIQSSPILYSPRQISPAVIDSMETNGPLKSAHIYGGPSRIDDGDLERLLNRP